MEFLLKNVGKIREANIELNGITVIAGENNTGKSTVGKMLYCVMNAFHGIDEKVEKERRDAVEVTVNEYLKLRGLYDIKSQALFINEIIETCTIDNFLTKLSDCFLKYFGENLIINKTNGNNNLDNIYDVTTVLFIRPIHDYLKLSKEDIIHWMVKKYFEEEFSMNICHVNYKEEASAVRLINGKDIIEINFNNIFQIKQCHSLDRELIYIDDPFVLDLAKTMNQDNCSEKEHKNFLLSKIRRSKGNEINALEEIRIEKKLIKVMNLFNKIYDGELCATEDNKSFVLRSKSLRQPLDIVNLSTGLKTFVILRTLIQNGSIKEGDIVVLDEPEIHLHPEWQLRFAELIVLLQKEFHLKILLNTHSPYFLNAIEVFSMHYGTADKCKYYLTQGNHNDERINIVDVTDNVEKIYEKLARPLQDLENMGYKYE